MGGVDERCVAVGGVDEGVGRSICENLSTILLRSETLDKHIFWSDNLKDAIDCLPVIKSLLNLERSAHHLGLKLVRDPQIL